jgi:hypothetical protein
MPMPAFIVGLLKSVGGWLLKLILGGFADGVVRAQKEKAEREKDALKTQLESVESGKNLEMELKDLQEEVEILHQKKLDERKDDPLGFGAYNEIT